MSKSSTVTPLPAPSSFDLLASLRKLARGAIEELFEAELDEALGAGRYQRNQARLGHRNGHQERTVVTELGPATLSIPRARLAREDGQSGELHSELLPRYQRRTQRVDEAILGCYLAGMNTRRVRKALAPLLGEAQLSRSSISRVVKRLKRHFQEWMARPLSEEQYAVLYLDGLRLPVRLARRVVKVPVQVVLGVTETGEKVLVSLQIAGSESLASGKAVVADLRRRGMPTPQLVVLDGNGGLVRSVKEGWPTADVQRCAKHKLENLLAKAPRHCHGELRRDYRGITHAESLKAAQRAYDRFCKKWSELCPSVVKSLQEAGTDLLTFYRYPRSQWRSLRTTNQIERLNGEFRRRTKTQGSFRTEGSALELRYGLIAMGQIHLRRINGYKDMAEMTEFNSQVQHCHPARQRRASQSNTLAAAQPGPLRPRRGRAPRRRSPRHPTPWPPCWPC